MTAIIFVVFISLAAALYMMGVVWDRWDFISELDLILMVLSIAVALVVVAFSFGYLYQTIQEESVQEAEVQKAHCTTLLNLAHTGQDSILVYHIEPRCL